MAAQIAARRFHPWVYWATIIATTTVGTTLADFATRSLGIGYAGGSALLLACCSPRSRSGTAPSAPWRSNRSARRPEIYYWVTIMFSQTLGTALGDWTADSAGFGYGRRGDHLRRAARADRGARYWWSQVSRTALFWAAFVLTRPLGAVLGDLLDKPIEKGGFAFSQAARVRPAASGRWCCAWWMFSAAGGRAAGRLKKGGAGKRGIGALRRRALAARAPRPAVRQRPP